MSHHSNDYFQAFLHSIAEIAVPPESLEGGVCPVHELMVSVVCMYIPLE